MYQLMTISAAGEHLVENLASAKAALELGRQLIAAGHTEIMVTTPDGRAFLFREFVALMGQPDKPA